MQFGVITLRNTDHIQSVAYLYNLYEAMGFLFIFLVMDIYIYEYTFIDSLLFLCVFLICCY